MTKEELHRLSARYADGVATVEEVKVLEAYLDSLQSREASPEWTASDEQEVEVKLYSAIVNRIKEQRSSKANPFRYRYLAAAVVFLLAIASLFYFQQQQSPEPIKEVALMEKTTQNGQKSVLVLGDGTRVSLNAGGKLIYPEVFDSELREVFLEGEAFFEVTHNPDQPFVVQTHGLTTRVLGTTFNVNAFPEASVEVTLASGKVSVSKSGDRSNVEAQQILAPGQQAIWDMETGSLIKKEVDLEAYLAWKEGELRLDDLKMAEAVVLLERWYGVTIELGNERLQSCKIARGRFNNQSLSQVLDNLGFFLGTTYEFVEDKKVIINGNGCETP